MIVAENIPWKERTHQNSTIHNNLNSEMWKSDEITSISYIFACCWEYAEIYASLTPLLFFALLFIE